MARIRRAPPKDPKAAEAYYAAEALAAESQLSPAQLDNALGLNPYEQTMQLPPQAAQDRRELVSDGPSRPKGKSIINTATRGDEDKQRIATPWAFIHALEQRFGVPVDFDLAAEEDNSKAAPLAPGFTSNYRNYFGPDEDSLKQDWSIIEVPRGREMVSAKLAFLNPPFAHIKPWAIGPKDNPAAGMLACRWLPRWTVMLVPASYSTDWFLELKGKVQRDAIPRIQFEGNDKGYPKDLTLIVAGFGVVGDGYWDWRVSYLQWCRDYNERPDPVHAKGCSALVKEGRLADYLPDYACTRSPFAKPV